MAEFTDPQFFVPVKRRDTEKEGPLRPPVTYWRDAWRRLRRNPMAMVSLAIVGVFVVLAVVGPELRGLDYVTINAAAKNAGISKQFWFGADNMGRDLFSNLWLGLRVSLLIAFACGTFQIVVGSLVGGLMAYAGRPVDMFFLWLIEIISSVPELLIIMVLMMVLGNGVFSLLLAINITSWCGTARQVRGQIMQLREMEYILAAESLGSGLFRTIFRHLIPNTIGVLIVNVTSSIPGYIFMESGLSFIGLGLKPPTVSLGMLIASGKVNMDFHPHQLFFPSMALCLAVLAFNLLGDGLRNALDPKLRQ
jgi:oligopeptide transport system permease protein